MSARTRVGAALAVAVAWGALEAGAAIHERGIEGPRDGEIASPPAARRAPAADDWVALVDAACPAIEAVPVAAPIRDGDTGARFRGVDEALDLHFRVLAAGDLGRVASAGPTPFLRWLARRDPWAPWTPQVRAFTKRAVDFDAAIEAIEGTPVVLFFPDVGDPSARSFAGAAWVDAMRDRGVEVLVPFAEIRDAGEPPGRPEWHRAVAAHIQRWLGQGCGPVPVVRRDEIGAVPVSSFDGLDVSFKTE